MPVFYAENILAIYLILQKAITYNEKMLAQMGWNWRPVSKIVQRTSIALVRIDDKYVKLNCFKIKAPAHSE